MQFVHYIDSYKGPLFHSLTSAGLKALEGVERHEGEKAIKMGPDDDSEDEEAANAPEGG
jgi:hypothetical protein